MVMLNVHCFCLISLSPDEEIEQIENSRLTAASEDGDKHEANEGDEEADDDDADEAGPSYQRKVSARPVRRRQLLPRRDNHAYFFRPKTVFGGAAASDVPVAVAGRQQLLWDGALHEPIGWTSPRTHHPLANQSHFTHAARERQHTTAVICGWQTNNKRSEAGIARRSGRGQTNPLQVSVRVVIAFAAMCLSACSSPPPIHWLSQILPRILQWWVQSTLQICARLLQKRPRVYDTDEVCAMHVVSLWYKRPRRRDAPASVRVHSGRELLFQTVCIARALDSARR